jgi:hypothetical protein
MIAELKERAFTETRRRSIETGRVPRHAYAHYFLEGDGIHSRIHLQNFWSTFWPQLQPEATATIHVYGADGSRLGTATRTLMPFGSMFLEMADLLAELRAGAREGTVAIDLEPPAEVRASLGEMPNPLRAEINTPYWMAYYDDAENYMYVHSIEKLGGEVFGTTRPMRWLLTRPRDAREPWRSWRLLDLQRLSDLQIVVINHSRRPGRTTVGLFEANEDAPIVARTLDLGPRALERVRFHGDELASALARRPDAVHGRIGLDPLLTGNGKPYVLLRYGDGPLSLHHG